MQITYPTKVLYSECIKNSPISTVRNIQFRKWAKVLKRQFNQRGYMDNKACEKVFKIINYWGRAT